MTDERQVHEASCACGGLRLTAQGEPRRVSMCHCDQCQRRTGAPFGLAAFFARADVETSGPERTYSRTGASGFDLTFHFCPSCGSTVFWDIGRRPDAVAVAVGAFADPSFPGPAQSVWMGRKHPWVRWTGDLPEFPENS